MRVCSRTKKAEGRRQKKREGFAIFCVSFDCVSFDAADESA